MKKLCVVLFAVMVLAGCAGKEKKVICTENESADEWVYEFNAKGDTLNSHNINLKIALADFELTEEDLAAENTDELLESFNSMYIDSYNGLKGVSVSSKIDDAKEFYIASIKMNFEEADFEELIDAGFLDEGTKEISLELTLEDYTGCVEQELE